MTELNPLIVAIGDIDDVMIEKAQAPLKNPLKLRALFISVAAAVLLLTGAAVIYDRYPKSMTINGEPMFEYNYAIMESVSSISREQMLAMGAEIINDHDNFAEYRTTALPSEIFTAFNMPSRINDNFIEEKAEIKIDCQYESEQPEEVAAIFLRFSLVDKNNRKSVDFKVDCTRSEEHVLGGLGIVSLHQVDGKTHHEDVDKELLTLNDGSQAVAFKWGPDKTWCASFAYDGLVYTEVSVDSSDYDDMITVLTDLDVI